MYITDDYLGTTHGRYRYLFYMLYEDYVGMQNSFMREINPLIERFARNLGNDAAVIKPFVDDISKTKGQILAKNWSDKARQQICNTPGMLMLNIDLANFDPDMHSWFYFHFGDIYNARNVPNLYLAVEEFFKKLELFAQASEIDMFQKASKLNNVTPSNLLSIIEIKPSVFGISLDIIRGLEILRKILTQRD